MKHTLPWQTDRRPSDLIADWYLISWDRENKRRQQGITRLPCQPRAIPRKPPHAEPLISAQDEAAVASHHLGDRHTRIEGERRGAGSDNLRPFRLVGEDHSQEELRKPAPLRLRAPPHPLPAAWIWSNNRRVQQTEKEKKLMRPIKEEEEDEPSPRERGRGEGMEEESKQAHGGREEERERQGSCLTITPSDCRCFVVARCPLLPWLRS